MIILFLALGLVSVLDILAFSFSFDKPSPEQCGTVYVSWQGGVPPFSLSILVSAETLHTISGIGRQADDLYSLLLTIPQIYRYRRQPGTLAPKQENMHGRWTVKPQPCHTTDAT